MFEFLQCILFIVFAPFSM